MFRWFDYIAVLLVKQVRGAILIRILASTVVGIFLGVTQLPTGAPISAPPSIKPVFMQLEWNNILSADMLIIMITFLFVDMFDTIGALVGVSTKAGLVDENRKPSKCKKSIVCRCYRYNFRSIAQVLPL